MKKTYRPEDIEVITTVRFATPDGEIHNTLAEALAHTPIYHPAYKMFAANGDEGVSKTKDVDLAAFVYCPDTSSAEDFINDCQSEGCTVDGINGKGLYIWDSNSYAWVLMPEGTISLFENFLL